MDTTEALELERIPAVAAAVREAASLPHPRWTLYAREPDEARWRELPLGGYDQGRRLALDLSEQGFEVAVEDPTGRVRLRVWPPSPNA
jgi:hypothetical protein